MPTRGLRQSGSLTGGVERRRSASADCSPLNLSDGARRSARWAPSIAAVEAWHSVSCTPYVLMLSIDIRSIYCSPQGLASALSLVSTSQINVLLRAPCISDKKCGWSVRACYWQSGASPKGAPNPVMATACVLHIPGRTAAGSSSGCL